jgi:hypothetical protein
VRAHRLALLALVVSVATVVAFVVLLQMLVPLRPAWYLGALAIAAVVAAVAVAQSRRSLTVSALVVSVLLLALAGVFNFVLMRVPATQPAFVIGQPAPELTLRDAAGQPVSLADYRGRQPVVLVFYRGDW